MGRESTIPAWQKHDLAMQKALARIHEEFLNFLRERAEASLGELAEDVDEQEEMFYDACTVITAQVILTLLSEEVVEKKYAWMCACEHVNKGIPTHIAREAWTFIERHILRKESLGPLEVRYLLLARFFERHLLKKVMNTFEERVRDLTDRDPEAIFGQGVKSLSTEVPLE